MTRHRPTRRSVVTAASGLALLTLAGCSSSSDTADAAQDAGYRSGDGSVTMIAPDERGEPVELSGETLDGTTWDR